MTHLENPFAIGKVRNPRYFNGIHLNRLNAQWKSDLKIWMTRDINTTWLTCLNEKMITPNRKIILFTDKTTPHLQIELAKSDCFSSSNNTASCHPLNQGITQNF